MKFRIIGTIGLALVLIHVPGLIYGQISMDQVEVGVTLSETALLDIEPDGGSVSLMLNPPEEAGLPLVSVSNTDSWLNYSLCIEQNDVDHFISVAVASGNIPAGLELSVMALPYSGSGGGTFGSPTGLVVLTPGPQILISGIRGAFTGDGVNNGHRLIYELTISDYGQVDFDQSNNLLITYTISD